LVLGTLNQIASFLAPLLLVLFAAAAFVIRRAPNFAQIISAYSLLGCLLAFANLIEPALAYYFIPVYALILASVTDKRTLAVGIGTAVLSGTAPEGPFQFILPLASLFLITILQDFSSRTHDEAATSLAEGPENVRLSKPRGLFDDARVPL